MAAHSAKIPHKVGPHHLSQQSLLKDGSTSDGWVESLTSLTESVQATRLLDEEAAAQAAVRSPTHCWLLVFSPDVSIMAIREHLKITTTSLLQDSRSHGHGVPAATVADGNAFEASAQAAIDALRDEVSAAS